MTNKSDLTREYIAIFISQYVSCTCNTKLAKRSLKIRSSISTPYIHIVHRPR